MKNEHIPKIELHVHLDCCLSFDVVQKLDASIDERQYRKYFRANGKCANLADYLQRATRAVDLMQSDRSLKLVTDDLFDQLVTDRVIYAEIRFAPLLHTRQGLGEEEIVRIVTDAVAENIERTGISANLILCTLRHYSQAQSISTAELVYAFRDQGVVALDLAADEAGFSIDNHVLAFEYAKANGMHTTAHAGEACSAESVWETIDQLKPDRIGHGIRASEDPALVEYIKHQGIHLEICPTSNIQTNIYSKMYDHPVDQLLGAGISLSINTDGRTISGTSLTEEYTKLVHAFSWGLAEFRQVNCNALDAAFIDEDLKRALSSVIDSAYGTNLISSRQ
ncbi:MAG: adenosine deaminase [Saprospiraceae bacterium]|nr:adenosine deaminase [Saprospiraceae bacterium]